MSKPLFENTKYKIVVTDDAIGEDGNYGRPGYACINKDTNIVEVTGLVLPQMMFFAEQSETMLDQLNDDNDAEALIQVESGEDVVPH